MKNTTRHTDERIGGLASAKTVHGEPRHKRLFLGGMVALGALLAACGSHTFEISGSGGHSGQVSSGGGSVVVHGNNGTGSYSIGNQLPSDYPSSHAPLPSGAKVLSAIGGSKGSGAQWAITTAVHGPVDAAVASYQHTLTNAGYTVTQVSHTVIGSETMAMFKATSAHWSIAVEISNNSASSSSGSSDIPSGDIMCTLEVASPPQ